MSSLFIMKRKTTEQFIEEAKLIHGDKYDYSLVEYVNSTTKVKIICNKKTNGITHGVFEQDPHHHLLGSGCSKCNGIKKGDKKSFFIERANVIHNNKYDYSLVEYKNARTKVKIICKKHGLFEQTPDNHLKYGCKYCRESSGEKRIRIFCELNKIEKEQPKTYPDLKDVNNLSYDFYIPSKNLLIEYNGIQHYKYIPYFHKTNKDFHKQKYHDWLKRKYAKDNKINLLVIPYWEDLNKILNEVFK